MDTLPSCPNCDEPPEAAELHCAVKGCTWYRCLCGATYNPFHKHKDADKSTPRVQWLMRTGKVPNKGRTPGA